MRIAIVFCCFNRMEMTKRCLQQLFKQTMKLTENVFEFFVWDDASTDGTAEMIEQEFPSVRLFRGAGGLYWCKSMHHAMQEAVKGNFDLYLMVNDDVDFADNALAVMLDAYHDIHAPCGIVGTTTQGNANKMSYGGRNEEGQLIEPCDRLQTCMWANWNCFLTDQKVVDKVGIIDGKYQHSWGDFDYSFRMKKAGFEIYVAPQFIGKCELNSKIGSYRDSSVKRGSRIKKMLAPKGMPFYSYMRYHIRTKGEYGIFMYLYGYMSLIGYILLGKELE